MGNLNDWPRRIWSFLNSRAGAAVLGALVSTLIIGIVVPFCNQLMSEEGKIEEKIREIIEQEANLVLEGKIDDLMLLYDEEAFVRDAAGGNTTQEIIWKGRNEIAGRYRNLPEFIYLKHDATEITVSSDKTYARAIADTIGVYKVNCVEVKISSNRGEKWTFEKINGEWKITSFTYNLP